MVSRYETNSADFAEKRKKKKKERKKSGTTVLQQDDKIEDEQRERLTASQPSLARVSPRVKTISRTVIGQGSGSREMTVKFSGTTRGR